MQTQLPSDTIGFHSKMESANKKIVWKIDNFSVRTEQTGQAIESPKFETIDLNGDKQKWSLQIFPRESRGSNAFVTACIKLVECTKVQVMAKIMFAIQSASGKETHKSETTKIFVVNQVFTNEYTYSIIKRDSLLAEGNELLPNNQLTIICNIDIYHIFPETVMQSGIIQIPPQCQCQFTKAVGTLWEKKPNAYTDCVLITSDNKQIKAHKLVLACHSPVFAAMFEHGTTEARTNQVNITDIRAEVVDQMLHFIYTGAAPKLDTMAKELFAAADKYQLDGLKLLCERSLILSLNNGNACELLVFADLHSAGHLKSAAFQFIKSHAEQIDPDAWKILCKEHPHLVLPVFDAMTNRK